MVCKTVSYIDFNSSCWNINPVDCTVVEMCLGAVDGSARYLRVPECARRGHVVRRRIDRARARLQLVARDPSIGAATHTLIGMLVLYIDEEKLITSET